MRSLFLKIFLMCWVASVIVFGGLVTVLMRMENHSTPGGPQRLIDYALAECGQEAVRTLQRDGAAGVQNLLKNIERETQSDIFLFDEHGNELSGRVATPDAVESARHALQADNHVGPPPGKPGNAVAVFTGPDQRRYVIVGHMPRPFRLPAMPLLALAGTAAVVSFWLARHVTAPVRQLRKATQRLADGDLSARVGASLNQRRDLIGELGSDFDHMAERLESLVFAQRRLLRDVSHELRSPLARLNVALGLATRRAGPDAAQALSRIELESERLNHLIGQLLILARLDAGGQSMEHAPIDLAAPVRQVAADAGFESSNRGCQVQLGDCDSCEVLGVFELLHSAIENVVRNAVRYTSDDTNVEIQLLRQRDGERDWAIIRIRDHGPGVPQSDLAEIFRPFHRVTDARERDTGGVGLGLAITRRAIRIHGGSVSAFNADDDGLIVEIALPALSRTAHQPSGQAD